MENQQNNVQSEWIQLAQFINNEPESWKNTFKIIKDHHKEIAGFIWPYESKDNKQIIYTGVGKYKNLGNLIVEYANELTDFQAYSYEPAMLEDSLSSLCSGTTDTLLIIFHEENKDHEVISLLKECSLYFETMSSLIISEKITPALEEYVSEKKKTMLFSPSKNKEDYSVSNMLLAGLLVLQTEHIFKEGIMMDELERCSKHVLKEGYKVFWNFLFEKEYKDLVFISPSFLKSKDLFNHLSYVQKGLNVSQIRFADLENKEDLKEESAGSVLVYFADNNWNNKEEELEWLKDLKQSEKDQPVLAVSSHFEFKLKEAADCYYSFNMAVPNKNVLEPMAFVLAQELIIYIASLKESKEKNEIIDNVHTVFALDLVKEK